MTHTSDYFTLQESTPDVQRVNLNSHVHKECYQFLHHKKHCSVTGNDKQPSSYGFPNLKIDGAGKPGQSQLSPETMPGRRSADIRDLQEMGNLLKARYAFDKNASHHHRFWDSPYLAKGDIQKRLADKSNPPSAKERTGLQFILDHFQRFADPSGYIYRDRFQHDTDAELDFLGR